MRDGSSVAERSYRQHARHFQRHARGGSEAVHARTWLADDTVDAWRHRRLYRLLDPLLAADPGAAWLTVGDGRFGRDARYVVERGGRAVASDIADTLLREALASGFIPAAVKHNAEALAFRTAAFDYVLCKEAYHHFPRPPVALYEMLRVAAKGVVLIEPNDPFAAAGVGRVLGAAALGLVRTLVGRRAARHHFEESGNYVFTLSRREVEKVALGLNLAAVAWTAVNDAYVPGVEHEKSDAHGPLQRRIRRRIAVADWLCRLGLADHGLLAAVIFTAPPPTAVLDHLAAAGFRVTALPANPHLAEPSRD